MNRGWILMLAMTAGAVAAAAHAERFDAEGITIPFPQRDVHLYAVPAKEAS